MIVKYLGEQVQSVRVSRGWEDRWSPWCFGEQVQVMRVSRGYLEFLALTFLTGKWWPGVELGLIPQLLTCSPQFAPPPLFFPSLLLPSLPVGAPPGHLCYKTLACRLTSVYNHPLTTVAWITLRRVALGETLGLFRLASPGFESRTLHHERKELAYNGHGLPDSQTPCPVEGGTARAGHN